MTTPYHRLAALGLTLPQAPAAAANYVPTLRTGNLLHVSGQGPLGPDGKLRTGKVGRDISAEHAYEHARLAGLTLLAQVHAALGDLARITQVVKLLGMVNATEDFQQHPQVINGCSDLLVAVLGDSGRHSRSAIGVGSLPFGISVEVEATFEVRD